MLFWTHAALSRLMVQFASAMHLCWAVLLAAWPDAISVTAINIFTQAFGLPGTIGLLTVVALAALVGVAKPRPFYPWWRGSWLFPQACILMVSATSSLLAVLHGSYADGVVRGWSFILADQAPHILLAIFYAIAMILTIHYDHCASRR